MANQSGPIQEVSRLLDLVPFLSTHSYISIKDLASEFGVSEREIIKELEALSMCGLPGYTPYELIEIFFDTGYVTINNHDSLDIPRALTPLELSSLLLGLEILRESAVEESSGIVDRIDVLTVKLRSLIGNTVEVESNPASAILHVIEKALSQRKSLTIEYLSPTQNESAQRDIDPFGVEIRGSFQYLSAYCHQAEGTRLFRIDRIASAVMGERTPESTDISDNSSRETIALSITTSRRAAAELFSLPSIPKSGKVDADIYSRMWAEKAVIASAASIEVISPEDLRVAIKATAAKILALYSS